MSEVKRRILQVSNQDAGGGAERVAWDLFRSYRARGRDSWLAVGRKLTDDPDVLRISNLDSANPWTGACTSLAEALFPKVGRWRGAARLRTALRMLGRPRVWSDWRAGHEDFEFPGARRLLELPPERPDIVHCHNLHGRYFDLRVLPDLSRQVPLVLLLHDAWLLSGHCAHCFDCERWLTGCGQCPDLNIYPDIHRDGTAFNWQRKRALFAASRLFVATPCRWLMRKVEKSILAEGLAEARVIPYGLDLSLFHPAEKKEARERLRLPTEAHMLLFTANGIRRNIWKDYRTMRSAVAQVAERLPASRLLFVALGEEGPPERLGQAEIRFVPFQRDPAVVARYYQAADLYLHAARADTFPNTVLEALACGTPVVATVVGGIPEQIKSWEQGSLPPMAGAELALYAADQATGILTPPGDAAAMAGAIGRLLADEALRGQLGRNAAADARVRFDLQRQTDDYLAWYDRLAS